MEPETGALQNLFMLLFLQYYFFFFFGSALLSFQTDSKLIFLMQGLNQGPKNKFPVFGTASLNLAEYASAAEQKEFELNVPLTLSTGAAEPCPQLFVRALKCSSCRTLPCLILVFFWVFSCFNFKFSFLM